MCLFESLGHPVPEFRVRGTREHLGEAVHEVVDDGSAHVAERVDTRLHGIGHLLTGELHQLLTDLTLDVERASGGLVPGRPAHPGPEVLVADQFGELHPRGDLLTGRIIGEVGGGGANHGHRGRGGIRCAEGALHEIVDQPSAFLFGQLREPVHVLDLLGIGPVSGRGSQNAPTQLQHPDLDVHGVGVRRGDFRHRELTVQHPLDRGQVHAQLAQCAQEFQTKQCVEVVEPITGGASGGRRHHPRVGVEPDGPHGQAGPPGEFPDRVEGRGVHVPHSAVSSHWRLKAVSSCLPTPTAAEAPKHASPLAGLHASPDSSRSRSTRSSSGLS